MPSAPPFGSARDRCFTGLAGERRAQRWPERQRREPLLDRELQRLQPQQAERVGAAPKRPAPLGIVALALAPRLATEIGGTCHSKVPPYLKIKQVTQMPKHSQKGRKSTASLKG